MAIRLVTRTRHFLSFVSVGNHPLESYPELKLEMRLMDAETFSGDLRRGGPVPPGADFPGVDRHHRRLVDPDVGELDRPRCRRWPRSSRVEA